MYLNFFENENFHQILNMNLNKIIWKKKLILKDFFEDFFKNSHKNIQKVGGCASCYLVYTLMNVMLLYGIEIWIFLHSLT